MKIRLCGTDEVDDGGMLQVRTDGRPPFAVYNVSGTFYVTEDTCTHGKASLADEGTLDGHVVTCGWHDGQFDIRTGAACAMPCNVPIQTFPASVEDNAVFVDV